MLHNGTVLQAELVEDDDEEDYVLIKNLLGGTTRLARSQIRSVQVGPPAVTAPAPVGAEAFADSLPGGLLLTLSADKPEVQVRRVIATHRSFDWIQFGIRTKVESEPFCPNTCTRWVNTRERQSHFLVTGVAGADFTLPAQGSAATVHIRAGDSAARAGGFVLLIAGGLLALGGTSLTFYGNQDSGLRYGLGIPLLVGGLAAVGGGIAIVRRYRTVVQVHF